MNEFDAPLEAAKSATVDYQASEDVHVGSVGAALLTPDGRIFLRARAWIAFAGLGFAPSIRQ